MQAKNSRFFNTSGSRISRQSIYTGNTVLFVTATREKPFAEFTGRRMKRGAI